MSELTNGDILAMAKAVDLGIREPELTQVRYVLGAILDGMAKIDVPGLNAQEPLPIIPPREDTDG